MFIGSGVCGSGTNNDIGNENMTVNDPQDGTRLTR